MFAKISLIITGALLTSLALKAQTNQPQEPAARASPVQTTAQAQPLPDCPPGTKPKAAGIVPPWVQRRLNQLAAQKCSKYGICVDPTTPPPIVVGKDPQTGKACRIVLPKPPAVPPAPACVTIVPQPGQPPVTVCGTPTQPAANGQSK